MKANELRIGNYVKSDNLGIICTSVKSLYGFPECTSIVNHSDRVIDLSAIEPIPLTEEWLLKFGFEKESEIHYSKTVNGITYLYYTGTLGQVRKDIDENKILYLCEPKYIHSLQNVMFALTGEELTIK